MNSIQLQSHKKPIKTLKSLKCTLNFIQAQISSHHRLSLFVTLVLIPFIVISVTRISPPCFAAGISSAVTQPQKCLSGKVYVYDLPSKFNEDLLLHNCTDLNPWKWQCGIVSNHGYGGPAVELRSLLPKNLSQSWYRTNQFALELIFHHRILTHKCRTLEPESATAFYIPFYAGLAVGKYLWTKDTARRDSLCKEMLQWVHNQKHWQRSNGSDHFMAIGRITWDFRRLADPGRIWGSSLLNMPEMRDVTRFIIEKAPGDAQDVGVPYPTGFHPKTKTALNQWQTFAREYRRSSLFSFIGATRNWVTNDFRGLLFSYCKNESGSCRLIDCAVAQCSADSSVALRAFLGSEFACSR